MVSFSVIMVGPTLTDNGTLSFLGVWFHIFKYGLSRFFAKLSFNGQFDLVKNEVFPIDFKFGTMNPNTAQQLDNCDQKVHTSIIHFVHEIITFLV